ncbi:DUF1330 domain-containing protein [Labrenzia sp. PHM005]|uniref:DUF1330 domain-containing protein n=1 Tax=Labrenzia sp. PHM005 TaxID=2590016 RepID=UPI0011406FCF|nr:DUF1330 domain-containing protein [Labrenzia sp. PHM005]QDG78281.1 DUF1330 domain-containing protein [Labrenzia sp. PHM005]
MTAFIVGRMAIHNRDWMEEYFAKVPALIEANGGEFLVKGGEPEVLEGDETTPDAAFVIRFPSRDAALAFWNSDEFAPLVKLRQTGSTLQAHLYAGLEEVL